MKIFLAIFFSIGIVSTIVYAGLALGYRHRSAGNAQISFLTFEDMYKVAPDKWSYKSYWDVLEYYPNWPQDYITELVYMASYFDYIQFRIWVWRKKRENQRGQTDEKTRELYKSFYSSVMGTSDEHPDT